MHFSSRKYRSFFLLELKSGQISICDVVNIIIEFTSKRVFLSRCVRPLQIGEKESVSFSYFMCAQHATHRTQLNVPNLFYQAYLWL